MIEEPVPTIPLTVPATSPTARTNTRFTIALLSASPLNVHAHAVARAQRDQALRLDRVAGREAEAIAPGDRRENQHGFCHRERHADADARPRAEWNVGEAVPRGALLRQEPLRIEALRMLPERRLSMQQPGRDDDGGAGRNPMAEHGIFAHGLARDRMRGRIE